MNQLIPYPEETIALAAVGSAVLAFVAVLIAAISIYYTVRGLKLQRDHNRLSVAPVPFIALADYEDLLRVKIRNDGIGPLIVKAISYHRNGKANEHEDLVSYMPALPTGLSWSNFSSGYVRSIRPGDELFLLELEDRLSGQGFAEFRDRCRQKLAQLTITIEYTDIYGTDVSSTSRSLDWFGRRLASSRRNQGTE